jgi:hypothetical protein
MFGTLQDRLPKELTLAGLCESKPLTGSFAMCIFPRTMRALRGHHRSPRVPSLPPNDVLRKPDNLTSDRQRLVKSMPRRTRSQQARRCEVIDRVWKVKVTVKGDILSPIEWDVLK